MASEVPTDAAVEVGVGVEVPAEADVEAEVSVENQGELRPSQRFKPDLASESLFPALPASTVAPRKATWDHRANNLVVPRMTPESPSTAHVKSDFVTEIVDVPPQNLLVRRSTLGTPAKASSEILKAIIVRTSTSIDSLTASRSGIVTFVIRGKSDNVKRARRDVLAAFTRQTTISLTVPASARPHILGAGGKSLKGITARTGVKIDMPKPKGAFSIPEISIESYFAFV